MHSFRLQGNFIAANLETSNFLQKLLCLHSDFTVVTFQTKDSISHAQMIAFD